MTSNSLEEVLFQYSSQLCCLIGMDGYLQQVNPAWESLLGWSTSELMSQPWLTFVHPEEIKSTRRVYQQLVPGEPMQWENRYSCKNGGYCLLSWKMLLNEDGSVYGIGSHVREYNQERQAVSQIIQQQTIQLQASRQATQLARLQFQEQQKQLSDLQTEFELRLTAQVQQRVQEILMGENIPGEIGYTLTYEDLLRSMLEHLHPAIPHDVSGTILLLDTQNNRLENIGDREDNPPRCKLFLKSHRRLTAKLQADIRTEMLARLSRLNGERVHESSLTLHYLNGEAQGEDSLDNLESLLLVPLINSPYEDNQIIGLLFVGTEQAEQFNEEQIRLLYHLASNASISIQQLRSFFINLEKQDLENILDRLPEGVIILNNDRSIVLTNPIARNYLESLGNIDTENILQSLGNEPLEELIESYRDDGIPQEVTPINNTDLVIEVIVEPISLEINSGNWLVLLRDISGRKQVESEIRKALEKERQLNNLKTRLVRTISHEYRTPLATILLGAETLTKYYDRLARDRKFSTLNKIQNAAKRMAQMVDDILLTNRIESGQFEFNPDLLDVVRFCENLVEEIGVLDNHAHRIISENQGNCKYVRLDPTLLRQIIANLLTNAVKYSPEGSSVRLNINYSNESRVIFEIEDQGIGILPEDESKIFDSFYRASNVETIPGTGLGLAIVKKAVDLHGGEIRFRSEAGVGTTFIVSLPC